MTDRDPSKSFESIQHSLANRETVAPSGLEDSTPTGSGPFTALPSQFGRYRVTKLLGYGAMGTVYLAFDPELNREVALKIPKADLARDPALWERFQREARATGDLNFPSICGMYEIGQIDGTHYISMQYIDGRPLSEFVSDNQSPRKVAGVVRKLALGLAHAHERGIVHRDLKPANVMIDTKGDPVIMDFGLARRLEMGGDVRATQSGMIVGSPAYMSPEQAKAEHDQIGPRTDIYGLGVLFFELLTGSLPFRGPMVVVLGQIATQPPPKPSSLRADVDLRLELLCLKMLEKQPQHRPASMTEVAQTLTDWLKGGGSSPEIALREAASPTESVALTPMKPAAPPRTPKADGIEVQKQRVTDLLDKREYGAAIELLDKIVNLRDARFEKLVAWAKPKLKEVRATEQNVRQASAPSCDTAQQLLKHYDYLGVIQVLEQVPPAYRSVELRDLLEEVTNTRDECDHLQRDIEEAVRTGDTETLPALVKRLYKLKPNNKAIKQLYADLKEYGAAKVIARRKGQRRFLDPAGRVVEPQHIALGIVLVVGLFVGVTVMVRNYLATSGRSIRVPTPDQGQPKPIPQPDPAPPKPGPPQSKWNVLIPTKMNSSGGATLAKLEDNSILVSGKNPDQDGYVIDFAAPLSRITGVMLEVLPHETLPHNGPGRSNGNFLLTEFEVHGPNGHVEIDTAQADYSQPFCEIARVNDNQTETGWAINAFTEGFNVKRTAMFRMAKPFEVARATPLTIVLHHQSTQFSQQGIGRFRLSVTGDADPFAEEPSDVTAQNLKETGQNTRQTAGAKKLAVPVQVVNSIEMKLAFIPAGDFMMGSPPSESERNVNEKQRRVQITRAFYAGVHEVTQAEYARIMGVNPSNHHKNLGDAARAKYPVEWVSWSAAQEFCRKLSELPEEKAKGRVYTLPSEAQWEYACRADTESPFNFGESLNGSLANCDDARPYKMASSGRAVSDTSVVGSYRPNAFGLYDMHGNVTEWCLDFLGEYDANDLVNPTGAKTGDARVNRGGTFVYPAAHCRSAQRHAYGGIAHDIGFRVVMSIPGLGDANEGQGAVPTQNVNLGKVSDPNRRFAHWVIQSGGAVAPKYGQWTNQLALLPPGAFTVDGADLVDLKSIPESIEAIAPQLTLSWIVSKKNSPEVAIALAARNASTLRSIKFEGTVTDTQLAQLRESNILEGFEFYGCYGYSEAGVKTLKLFSNLKRATFNAGAINDAGLAHLAGLRKIDDLCLWATSVTDAGLVNLKGMSELQGLQLGTSRGITGSGIQHLVGLPKLKTLSLYSIPFGDAGMEHIGKLSAIESLILGETKITDAQLYRLDALSKLKVLHLHGTQVTDAGLAKLVVLGRLTELQLDGTGLTNAGLANIRRHKNLKRLYVRKTKVTEDAVNAFRKALPSCAIESDFPASKPK